MITLGSIASPLDEEELPLEELLELEDEELLELEEELEEEVELTEHVKSGKEDTSLLKFC